MREWFLRDRPWLEKLSLVVVFLAVVTAIANATHGNWGQTIFQGFAAIWILVFTLAQRRGRLRRERSAAIPPE